MLEILDYLQKHWGLVVTIVGVIGTLFWLKMDSKYAKKSDLTGLGEAIKHNDHRVTQLEMKVENLPTAQDVAQLQVLMTEIKGETKATNSQMQGISHQVGLLLEAKVLGKE